MAWKIRKVDGDLAHVVEDTGGLVATITYGRGAWQVAFVDAKAFDWQVATAPLGDGLERCVGYVRGVERAAEVHARETRSVAKVGGSRP
jgi:hypothetical protein